MGVFRVIWESSEILYNEDEKRPVGDKKVSKMEDYLLIFTKQPRGSKVRTRG